MTDFGTVYNELESKRVHLDPIHFDPIHFDPVHCHPINFVEGAYTGLGKALPQ